MLVNYRETVDPKSPNVVLFSPPIARTPISPSSAGRPPRGSHRRSARQRYGVDGRRRSGPLTPATPVTLTWDNGQGLVFRRTIAIDDNYMFTVIDEVENKTRPPTSR